MNDRYLYRAKRIDNGAWVEGFLFALSYTGGHSWCIGNAPLSPNDYSELCGLDRDWFYIDHATICQCTAMPDKNREIAYEHDIIKTPVGNAKIIWNCSPSPIDNHINVGFEAVFLDAIANDNYRHDLGYWIGKSEVIGSVFDDPELLEVGE